MPKGSPELVSARKEEIIAACETLYQTMGFREITIKEIADYDRFHLWDFAQEQKAKGLIKHVGFSFHAGNSTKSRMALWKQGGIRRTSPWRPCSREPYRRGNSSVVSRRPAEGTSAPAG